MAKVPEVDAKKRKQANIEAEIKAAEEAYKTVQEKRAEAEAQLDKDLKTWSKEDRQLSSATPEFMPIDYTYIPDYVDLPSGVRRTIKETGYHYRWVRFQGRNSRIPHAKMRGSLSRPL
jgi:hypothetical protein